MPNRGPIIRCALALLLGVPAAPALAQPLVIKDDGVYARMPERVEVAADGTMTVVTTDVGPIPEGAVMPELPEEIEVRSQNPSGEWIHGLSVDLAASRREMFPYLIYATELDYVVMPGSTNVTQCFLVSDDERIDAPSDPELLTIRKVETVRVCPEDPFGSASLRHKKTADESGSTIEGGRIGGLQLAFDTNKDGS